MSIRWISELEGIFKYYFRNPIFFPKIILTQYEKDSRKERKGEESGTVWTDEETCDLPKVNKY